MKKIEVIFHGGLDRYFETKKKEISLPENASFDDLFSKLDINKNVAGIVVQDDVLIEDFTENIKPEAKINIYPVVGGG